MVRRTHEVSRTPAQPVDDDVAAAAAGDQHAWERLVDRHAQRVWSTARGFGLDVPAATLVCQLSWSRLADHLDGLRTEEQLRDWVCTAAEHEARAMLYPE
jgi:DNA-directed RNA polymerase specialized sigma24 family protein